MTIPFRHLRFLFYPLHRGAFGIKRLSRGGESIVEFYIFSALHWESLRYGDVSQIFVRYLCNCGLEFWYCGISKHAEVFVIGSGIFSMVVSNFSISLCSVTVFRILLAALQSFFCACVFFCHKTSFDSVILCPVAVLERFTKQYFHDNLLCPWTHQQKQLVTKGIYIDGCWNPLVQPQQLHIVPFIIIIIITIILLLLLLLLLFEKVILVLIQY